ncbi:glycosyltransferase family 2 protein [Polaribacter vadi]|uniref:glycosyltransferase family 2 protein n=1 Tax=Polaribacter TaxID=52959 RepID=UPI001C095DA0|nr:MULTISPECIES: glycosyltransferase family 2 protein [Polaribacter]MBU3010326.1 glycosyltransferase family 2 protein [Polaribacter vadi]MDO6740133.1 glycosyltransferase family 2 protein [Polaribacter sp. 1_MG-2023]
MNQTKTIAAIILTYNEEQHIERCINSIKNSVDEIFIIDSFSKDYTVAIAERLGAKVYQNPWVNYATQFNWALQNCNIQSEWVWRIDADEYYESNSNIDLKQELANLSSEISGVYIKRKIIFMDKPLLHGGWFPVWHLKIWKFGKGFCENRWMDEHIKLTEGITAEINIVQVDENLNDLTWWTEKHNHYATREVVDLLDTQYQIFSKSSVEPKFFGTGEQRKRFLKLAYLKFPLFVRPFIYFSYRYFLKLGFLDGKSGFVWHILQGFWYRFLVDAKIYELKLNFKNDETKLIAYIKEKYQIK